MKIAILGTRGIPNHYGGFEQCAEYLAVGLVKKGFEVTVYNSHDHPYQESKWNGVNIIHCFDPEDRVGTIGQFIYDLNCIKDARKRRYDIILQLGYTSSSIWGRLLPKKSIVTTNMDGLEWKRTKFSKPVRTYIKYAEWLAAKNSNYLISDSLGIQNYLKETYDKNSVYIPYGAHLFNDPDKSALKEYNVKPYAYNILIARLEPENSIEEILQGVVKSENKADFLVIGKHTTKYGTYLKDKFTQQNIRFIGGIYNINILNNLRYFSNLYFHGHTVGGTNPSLLEAMASNSLICANDNPFNKFILNNDALYFTNPDQIAMHLKKVNHVDSVFIKMIENNRMKIKEIYAWENVVNKYADHFYSIAK